MINLANHIPILMIAFVVLLITLLISSTKRIKPSNVAMLERMGKFVCIKEPGWIILLPFIDKIRIVELKEQVIEELYEKIYNEDNIETNIKAKIFYQVVDPYKAAYEKANLADSIKDQLGSCLHNILIEMSLNEALTSNFPIREELKNLLNKAVSPWGLKMNKIELEVFNGI